MEPNVTQWLQIQSQPNTTWLLHWSNWTRIFMLDDGDATKTNVYFQVACPVFFPNVTMRFF